ncbi:beta-ketoacyl-ACP synthase II [Actinomadura fulvescens]|uniref:Beta-ketoacyl-ACP synthase II n=1 Tax=Actinomadura fulvescens TaxID=46160 RepID=A0ABN3Q3I3_9ACTN
MVTGLGVRTPAGNSPKELWDVLLTGVSTARRIVSFDTTALPVDFACEIHDFDPLVRLDPKTARRTDRTTQLAACAAADALEDAGGPAPPPERCAVIVGTGFGGLHTLESALTHCDDLGHGRIRALHIPMLMPNAASAVISMCHSFTGPTMTVSTSCASGGHAVGEGLRLLRDGSVDLALAGGTEANITANSILGFYRCGALSRRTSDPHTASRPFDLDRDGFVLGEAAAFLVLESMDGAIRRGARIYAELAGFGNNSDAYHLVAPRPGGQSALQCMQKALGDARLSVDDVVHINAHGTSTPLNDLCEAQAIAGLLNGRTVPVTATKSITGHTIGAAGALEAAVVALSLHHRTIPPTANLHAQDPDCEIDVVTRPRELAEGAAISNSFGFGGHNAVLVFTPPPS